MKQMCKKGLALLLTLVMVFGVAGCGNSVGEQQDKATGNDQEESSETNGTYVETKNENSTRTAISTDLSPSDGLEFESNGDGTCSIVGRGSFTGTSLVFPTTSPNGDVVTSIKEYSFSSLEDVDSLIFIDAQYTICKNTFQYGEIESISFIGGSPVIDDYAFYSCDEVEAISFKNCKIMIGEKAFMSAGDDSTVSFIDCSGTIDDNAFEYGNIVSLSFESCDFDIEKYAFYSCEDISSLSFSGSQIDLGEKSFMSSCDKAEVTISDCSMGFDDNSFEYSSIASLSIMNSSSTIGKYAFYGCEDLSSIYMDGNVIKIGKNAFASCEDLEIVEICKSSKGNNVVIDDNAFEYCENLTSVTIGKCSVTIGDYAFYGCNDALSVSIAGREYTSEALNKGFNT